MFAAERLRNNETESWNGQNLKNRSKIIGGKMIHETSVATKRRKGTRKDKHRTSVEPRNEAILSEGMKIRSIERIPVESSSLVSAGYDPASETLEVEFRTGIYQYVGVPTDRYEGLMAAESKGAYFNQFIRDAGYPFLKIG